MAYDLDTFFDDCAADSRARRKESAALLREWNAQYPAPARKKRRDPEHELQVSVVKHLRWIIGEPGTTNRLGVFWRSIRQEHGTSRHTIIGRNGRRINPQALKAKAAGVRSGVEDMEFIYQGRHYGIELKAGKNRTTEDQERMHTHLSAAGVPVAVCWSLDEVVAALRGWGVPLLEAMF